MDRQIPLELRDPLIETYHVAGASSIRLLFEAQDWRAHCTGNSKPFKQSFFVRKFKTF